MKETFDIKVKLKSTKKSQDVEHPDGYNCIDIIIHRDNTLSILILEHKSTKELSLATAILCEDEMGKYWKCVDFDEVIEATLIDDYITIILATKMWLEKNADFKNICYKMKETI